jgi:GntR family transcriptional regulator
MLISINPKSALPIYHQIAEQIRRAVAAGKLQPGEQLPSVRDLATQILVNPNTVARVYRDLEQEGLLETRRGQGTYIAAAAAALAEPERKKLITEQLKKTVQEVRHFGLSPEAALEIFRRLLYPSSDRKDKS